MPALVSDHKQTPLQIHSSLSHHTSTTFSFCLCLSRSSNPLFLLSLSSSLYKYNMAITQSNSQRIVLPCISTLSPLRDYSVLFLSLFALLLFSSTAFLIFSSPLVSLLSSSVSSFLSLFLVFSLSSSHTDLLISLYPPSPDPLASLPLYTL